MSIRKLREFDVVAIGSSAGGLSALREILSPLPAFFPASIVIAQHMAPSHPSKLAELLQRWTDLRVVPARHRTRLEPGTAYVAPPGCLMTVTASSKIECVPSPPGTSPHPSIDGMFRSVANAFGPRAIGVVLTGMGRDGAAGVSMIRARGGRAIAQEPSSASSGDMPAAAIGTGCVDLVLPVKLISKAMLAWVSIRGAAELFDVPIPAWASFA